MPLFSKLLNWSKEAAAGLSKIVLFLLKNPLLYKGFNQDITNFSSAILISSSIIFFYILPFAFQFIINKSNKIKFIIFEIFKIKYIFFISILFFVLSLSFYYNGEVGGGIFYRISNIIFKNNYIFFMASYLGLYLILFYSKKIFQITYYQYFY